MNVQCKKRRKGLLAIYLCPILCFFSILSDFLSMFTKLWHLIKCSLADWITRPAQMTYNPTMCLQLRLWCLRYLHLIICWSRNYLQNETIFVASENLLTRAPARWWHGWWNHFVSRILFKSTKDFCTVASQDWTTVWFTTEAPEFSQLTRRTRHCVVWISWWNWSQMLSSSGRQRTISSRTNEDWRFDLITPLNRPVEFFFRHGPLIGRIPKALVL